MGPAARLPDGCPELCCCTFRSRQAHGSWATPALRVYRRPAGYAGWPKLFRQPAEGLQALPCRRSTGLDAGEVIAPMACETPPALSSERAAELGKHAESSLLAFIRELVGLQRDQLG